MNNTDKHQNHAGSPNADAPIAAKLALPKPALSSSTQVATSTTDKTTVIVYLRTATSGSKPSIDYQREVARCHLDGAGLTADEFFEEYGSGTKISDNLESILVRAEGGERIMLVMSHACRIARDLDEASTFVERALNCGMQLVMGDLMLTDCLSSIMVWHMCQAMAKSMQPRRRKRNVARRSPAN